jgi:hypothetical protein
MKNIFIVFPAMVCYLYPAATVAQIGKVGINTSSPQAMLHVKDGSVLFSGATTLPGTPGNPPDSGIGVRMMWYPDKAAFRAGYVISNQWDKDSIGNYSFASGASTKAKGNYSTALGYFTNATGDYSTALGYAANASGFTSTAMGYAANASGFTSTALGYYTNATGDYSTALGIATNSRAHSSVVLGRYNDSISNSSTTSWIDTDPVFMIGNGTASNARRNAFLIAKNGETGINVANGMPQALLHLKARENTSDMHIRLENDANGNYTSVYYNGSDMTFRTSASGNQYVWRNSAGTGNMYLQHGGDLFIQGTYNTLSDGRFKRNITPLQNSLEKILLLKGYHYYWKAAEKHKRLQSGLIAQEVENQMPELVLTNDEGVKSVNYNGMIPYLVEAIKELKAENQLLKIEILKLKKAKR